MRDWWWLDGPRDPLAGALDLSVCIAALYAGASLATHASSSGRAYLFVGLGVLTCVVVRVVPSAVDRLMARRRVALVRRQLDAMRARHEVVVGIARGIATLRSPIAKTACLAYSASTGSRLREQPLLCDAVTEGFEVELEDGRSVVVPAGRVRLMARGAPARRDRSWGTARAILDGAGLAFVRDEPFRGTATEHVLRPGDRVTLGGDLLAVPRTDAPAGYRETSLVFVPHGVARVEVC